MTKWLLRRLHWGSEATCMCCLQGVQIGAWSQARSLTQSNRAVACKERRVQCMFVRKPKSTYIHPGFSFLSPQYTCIPSLVQTPLFLPIKKGIYFSICRLFWIHFFLPFIIMSASFSVNAGLVSSPGLPKDSVNTYLLTFISLRWNGLFMSLFYPLKSECLREWDLILFTFVSVVFDPQ